MVEVQLADKQNLDLAIAAVNLAKEVLPPTIELIKGHVRKRTAKVRLVTSAVFTFYDPISMEDYYSSFVNDVTENKVAKNKLKIGEITVGYSISPTVKTYFPVALADYGEDILEKQDELVSVFTRIVQIRVFMFPLQQQMSSEDLETFIKAFDGFIGETETRLRAERKLRLNVIVKHLVFETSDVDFLQNCSRLIADESLRIYCSNSKISVTYSKLDKLLDFTSVLW